MRVQRLCWLSFSIGCGLIVTIAMIGLARSGSTHAVAVGSVEHSGVVLYVSKRGTDNQNNCMVSQSPCYSIRHALQVAQAGDYIHVAGGVYTDLMTNPGLAMGITATVIISKDISSLLGGYATDFSTRDIEANETILSAAGSPGAHVAVLANTNVRFGGFTLTGGSGAYSAEGFKYPGGAIRIFGGSPTIQDNTIIKNQGYRRGGGIYVGRDSTATILHNKIVSNTVLSVEGDDTSAGGGIYIASGPTLIQDNLILSNTAQVEGGGIYVGWDVPAEIISNTIAYNKLLDPLNGHGAGVHTTGEDSVVVIRENTVYKNALNGGFEGSGLYVSSPAIIETNWIENNNADWGYSALCVADVMSPITLTNNVIVGNASNGVRSINNQDIHLINNTIVGNTLRGVQVQFPEFRASGAAAFTLQNNIIANNGECGVFIENVGNQQMDYNLVFGQRYQYCGFPSIQSHNLSVDPAFVNPSVGNYRLIAGSPAINQGNGAFATLTDYEGILRLVNYNVDIGAYEFIYKKAFLPVLWK